MSESVKQQMAKLDLQDLRYWNGQIQKVKDGVDTTGDGDQVRVCHLAPWGWVIPCCGEVS